MAQPDQEQKARKTCSPVKDIYCKEISLESQAVNEL